MELEPRNLNIPLERKGRWGLVLAGVCILAAAIAWFLNPSFARAFVASCIVALPALWLFFLPPAAVRVFTSRTPRALVYVLLFGYLALAKAVLVPIVLRLLEHAGA
jgi:hypothetical protein